tara:strand:- start:521 stop:1282 length:762 start_codon:yes stop_codon:yes gene_type:complete
MTDTAFVIGTGPSLNKIDMHKLKNYDCVTFNRAYIAFDEWGFIPRYYLAIDGNDIRSVYKDINKLIKKHRNTDFFILDNEYHNSIHPETSFQDNEKKESLFDWSESNLYRIQSVPSGFFTSAKKTDKSIQLPVHLPNAGWMGVELLYALGYKKIGFVGCDSRYKDDSESNVDITAEGREYISHADTDINHFRSDYFGKGVHFGKPNADEIVSIWRKGAGCIPKDLEMFSCTPGSAVNPWYNYRDFDGFFNERS